MQPRHELVPWITADGQRLCSIAATLVRGNDEWAETMSTCGVARSFFGGMFPTLIAASEAFTQSGWEMTKQAVVDLCDEAEKVLAESAKDDAVDADALVAEAETSPAAGGGASGGTFHGGGACGQPGGTCCPPRGRGGGWRP